MKNLKHTPGPWQVGANGFGNTDYVYCNDSVGSAVAKCNLEFTMLSSEQIEANKKLIAAAPDLLEALRNIQGIEAFINDPVAKEIFQKNVYPAINKATGND